ncbi:hypothetical protein C8R46DRAFT_335588 [Mycena filopes]|nr:hypothetical protein C8R46DRAFT_335588 [Mycena filopes]
MRPLGLLEFVLPPIPLQPAHRVFCSRSWTQILLLLSRLLWRVRPYTIAPTASMSPTYINGFRSTRCTHPRPHILAERPRGVWTTLVDHAASSRRRIATSRLALQMIS